MTGYARPMRLRWLARRQRLRWILGTVVVIVAFFAGVQLIAELVVAVSR